LFDEIAALQQQKRALGEAHQAFVLINNPTFASATVRRAVYARMLADARARNAPADSVDAIHAQLVQIGDHPRGIERRLLVARMDDFARFLGPDHNVTAAALGGRS